jgi:hypothetical protein
VGCEALGLAAGSAAALDGGAGSVTSAACTGTVQITRHVVQPAIGHRWSRLDGRAHHAELHEPAADDQRDLGRTLPRPRHRHPGRLRARPSGLAKITSIDNAATPRASAIACCAPRSVSGESS